MINIYYRNLRDKGLQKIDNYRVGAWIHIEEPTDDDIQTLVSKFNLDESLLMDAIDQYEVPRLEVEDNNVYIFSRYPFKDAEHISTSPILIVFTEENMISVTMKSFPLLDGFLKRGVFFTTQKTKTFLQLFSVINTAYNTYLHSMSRLTRSSAHELEKIRNKDIVRFVNDERVLNDFHLALVRTNAVLNKLLSHNYIPLFDEDRDLVEDLFLSNDQLIQVTNENLTSIVNIRDAYSTIMTHNTNRVVRLFTSVTVILTIPTIIASIYGMNVKLPYDKSPYAFGGIMLITLLILILLTYTFIRNDWL